MLPNGYTYMTGLESVVSAYIDTGIKASSDLEVELYYGMDNSSSSVSSTDGGYVMGARDSNSNTSANQFNLYKGKTNTNDYVGFVNQRLAQNMGIDGLSITRWHFSNVQNVFSLIGSRRYASQFTGKTDSFTGNQNIYLFAMNNAGTPVYHTQTMVIYGCKFTKNGSMVRNFVPVYNESTSKCGLFDLVNNVYYPSSGSVAFDNVGYEVNIDNDGNGKGYLVADGLGNVQRARFLNETSINYSCSKTPITLTAIPNEGYEFQSWTVNDTVVSYEKDYSFLPDARNLTIKANFLKKAMDMPIGCKAVVLAYGIGTGTIQDSKKSRMFLNVVEATIKYDLMQRSTSKITVESVPSNVGIDCPIFLYSARNKLIYCGIIKAIEEKVLTCREPISIFDDDYLFSQSNYNAHYTVSNGIYQLLTASQNWFVGRKTNDIYPYVGDPYMETNSKAVDTDIMPEIESEVVNLESKLYDFYNSYGIFMEPSYYERQMTNRTYLAMKLVPVNGYSYPTLVVGDNVETLTDVDITSEIAETTLLEIYNKAGTTLRSTYLMCNDGVIRMLPTGVVDTTIYVANTDCKRKIVLSDDNEKTLAKENLNDSLYTHSIKFTLHMGGLITLDDIKIGQPVKFYYKNQMYDSCVTAYEFELGQFESEVKRIKFTLGRVRKSLTAKLNLGKVK